MMKKVIIALIATLVVATVGIICFFTFFEGDNGETNTLNEVTIDENINKNTVNNIVQNNIVNEINTNNKRIKEISLSDDEILNILIDVEPFDGVEELSDDKKIAIVYNALNENKIKEYKSRGNNQAYAEYEESEINGIIYSLFGVKLLENKSYGSVFIYKDGKYVLEHSDRGEELLVAQNVERDVAAGTVYINYDLYRRMNGNQVFEGRYAIGRSNTKKNVTCKKKM